MANLVADHPTPAQLRSFFEGKLAPDEFTSLEEHLTFCASCCRVLENVPADSFVGRLKSAEQAAFATTADGSSATLLEVTGIPPELANHPRYRVLSLIGQGGMGAVFKAEHRRMERVVALKVINPGLMKNLATVGRFQQEVRAAAKLAHPNIVTAHDADQAGGLHFLVMEYVEGKTLAGLLAERGSLPIPEACEYVRQAAIGLQHLFEAGLIHRDIKPHNLMRASNGTIKLLDCGLARFADESAESFCPSEIRDPQLDRGLTGAGTVMGTADYIAPEQIADSRTAEIRSDIYSLGCTFYHLLTGKPPFAEGTTAEKFKQHKESPFPYAEDWPVALKDILRRMTRKNPNERYASPIEVAKALEDFTNALKTRPLVSDVDVGRVEQRYQPRRPSFIAARLFALAALIIAAVVVIKIQTDKGEITITTDDENIEIITKKGGDIVRIRDPKSGQAWELDTKKLTMRDLEHPDGLALEVPWRGKVTIKSSGGKVVVMAGPADSDRSIVPVPAHSDKDRLQGLWVAESAEELGRSLPLLPTDELMRLEFSGGTLRLMLPGSPAKPATYKIDPDANPKEIDVIRNEDEKGMRGIYRFDGDKLTLCIGDPGPNRPRAFRTTADTGNLKLITFRRAGAELDSQPLFNGKNFAGWQDFKGVNDPFKYWTIRDKALVAMPYADLADIELRTVNDYENYELRLEYRFVEPKPKTGTASILLHGRDRKMATPPLFTISLRPNIVPEITRSHGATYGKWQQQQTIPPKAGWNELRIEALEGSLKVYHNHALVATADDCSPSKGFIGLQNKFDGEVQFRNIAIGPLPRIQAVMPVRSTNPVELAKLANAADALKQSEIPKSARTYIGDANDIPPELVAVLGDIPKMYVYQMGDSALAFSPDGKYLASAGEGKIRLWDLASAKEAATWDTDRLSRHIIFSPDGKLLANSTANGISVHRVADGKTLYVLETKTKGVHFSAFSPDGSLLAAPCGNDVRVWRVADGKELRVLGDQNPAPQAVLALIFSRDGSKLVSAGAGITVWETQTGLAIKHLFGGSLFNFLEWLPDGKTLAAANCFGGRPAHLPANYGVVCHVDLVSGKKLKELLAPIPYNRPASLVLSPGARFVCLYNENGNFLLTQPGFEPERKRTFRHAPPQDYSAKLPRSAAFSPDGRYLACSSNPDGVIFLYRLADRGQLPQIPAEAEKKAILPATELLPAPREQLPANKLSSTPLDLSAKFPDNLYLVRAKLKEIDRRGPFGAPDKHRYVIEQVYAGPVHLKEMGFTYVPTLNFGSGPQTAYVRLQIYGDFEAGSEGLWWIKVPGLRDAFAMDDKGGMVPVLDRQEIELHAIEGFPINRSRDQWHLSWEEGLKRAEKVEQVYRAKTPAERGKLLWQMVVKDRPHIARWAIATLANAISPEGRKDLRARAEQADISVQESLLVDRVLARHAGKVNIYGEMMQMKENDEWLRSQARERLLRFCLQSNNEVEFELTCRRLSDAVRDHEIDFTLFSKVVDAQLNRGDKLSEDQQWSLGQTLLTMRFEMEPGAYRPVDPRKPKPFGLMSKEDRTKAMTWLFDIVDQSTSTVLRNHAAFALKHYGSLSDVQKKKLPFDLGPYPTQDDSTLAYRTAQNFVKDYATQKHVYVVGPFYLGGWLVPREKGWELPIKATSLDAVVLLDKKKFWLPSKIAKSELLELRPELTRDPLLKELAQVILKDKGLFYAVTMHGDHEMRLLVQVNNGHGYVRGFMPPVRHDSDPNEPAVRAVVQQFVQAHNTRDQPKLKELVSYPWCHGGKLWKVMDRKTTIELYPNPSMGTYGEGSLGHPGWGPKFPEKLPETILHVMRFGDHFPALLTTGEDERAISEFMGGCLSDTAYVVFLGKLNEGGGVALLVRIDKHATTKKEVIKVVGTLHGLH